MTAGNVSVVIPCFNQAGYLPAAVESALGQKSPPQEIIIVDDGSTDPCRAVCDRWKDRVKYIYQANGGVAKARNAGCRAARGEWIAFLDADDRFLPDCLDRESAVLAARPDVDVVSVDFWHVDVQGRRISRCLDRHAAGFDMVTWDRRDKEVAWVASHGLVAALVRDFFIAPAASLMRRSALDAARPFTEDYPTAEDLDLFLRMAKAGRIFAFVPEPLMTITQVPKSLSRDNPSVVANRHAVLESFARPHVLDATERRCIRREMAACEAMMAWQAFLNKDYGVSRSFAGSAFVHGERIKGMKAYLRALPILRKL